LPDKNNLLDEKYLRDVIYNMMDSMIVIDERGVILDLNPSAEKTFGYSSDETLGQDISMMMPEYYAIHHTEYIQNYLETGIAKVVGKVREVQGKRKDGSTFPIELEVNESTCRNGHRIFLGIVRDISRRKKLDDSIKRTNSLILGLVENISAGVLLEDERGKIETVNQVYCDIFNKTELPLFFEGTSFADESNKIAPLFRNASAFTSWQKTCRSGAPGTKTKKEIPMLDQRIIEVEYTSIITEDSDGQLHYNHFWTFLDISAHKRIESRLLQQSDKLEKAKAEEHTLSELLRLALMPSATKQFLDNCLSTLFDSLPWLRLQPQGSIFLTKPQTQGLALASTYGLDPELFRPCGTIQFGQCLCGVAASTCTVQYANSDNDNQDIKCLNVKNHGHYTVPLIQHETVLGVMMLYLPSNHQESTSETFFLERVAEILSLGISRRSSQKSLELAKQKAESATETKSQFLATMSHEIRTPLNGVLGMLHLLGNTELDKQQHRYLNTATNSSELLLTVINDILDYSKLESEKLDLESIPLSLATLVEETVALLANAANSKGLELISYIKPNVPANIKGDPTRIRQILTNLTSNAIKFTLSGEIVLYVTPVSEERILIGVKDTGIGLDETQQQRLFQPFTQADNTHTRRFGGTGLGLAICKKLVEAMDGNFRVSSSPGLGSDFQFELPLKSVDPKTSKTQSNCPHLLENKNVLLAVSNKTLHSVLTNIMHDLHVSDLDTAHDCKQALQMLKSASEKQYRYDAVLFDAPAQDDEVLKFIKHIRSDKLLANQYLVGISHKCKDSSIIGHGDWLIKPLRQSDIYHTLQRISDHQDHHLTSIKSIEPETKKSETWWFGGYKILLVEDNEINQQVAMELLTTAGFEVDLRENGLLAVQAVQENQYDIILMDIQMPVMDGLQASHEIRALGGKFSDIPILAMTAHAMVDDANKSLKAGMNAHITKPIVPDTLLTALANWTKPKVKTMQQTKPSQIDKIDLPNLPGIDVECGLQRLQGNWEAYRRLLISFAHKQANAGEQIDTLIKQQSWSDAAALAHTLKGNCGNLCITQLFSQASAMEQFCRDENALAAKNLLDEFNPRLAVVIGGLIKFEQSEQKAKDNDASGESLNKAETIDLLEKLIPLLDDDFVAAQSSIGDLKQSALGNDARPLLIELERASNNFDFEAAKQIVSNLKDSLD
jgi:two-component system, sensor histidine kinase and response regulator